MTQKCICHVCGRKFDANLESSGGAIWNERLVVACNVIDPKAHTPKERLISWQRFLEENRPRFKNA